MSTTLPTTSHGNIAAGLVTFLMSHVRIGRHFATLYHVCDLATTLSKSPSSLETTLLCYPFSNVKRRTSEQSAFWRDKMPDLAELLERPYLDSYQQALQKIEVPSIMHPKTLLLLMRTALYDAGWREGVTPEADKTNAEGRGYIIPVTCNGETQQLCIAEYEGIPSSNFAGLVWYMTHGGGRGEWINNDFPDNVLATLAALKNPKSNNAAFAQRFDYAAWQEQEEKNMHELCEQIRRESNTLSQKERQKYLAEGLRIIAEGPKETKPLDFHRDPDWMLFKKE